jgi:hypothetical protein
MACVHGTPADEICSRCLDARGVRYVHRVVRVIDRRPSDENPDRGGNVFRHSSNVGRVDRRVESES